MINPSKSHHIVSRWKVDLANRWYSIKSETLHIPDRFCFLRSEGPPPKKVFEVESLIRFWPSLSFYAISIGFAVHLGISQVWESPGYLFAHQIAYSHFFGYLAFYNHYRNSQDWGTWEYSDDATAPIHYGREIFECFWDWWEHLLLDFFLQLFFFAAVRWIDWPYLLPPIEPDSVLNMTDPSTPTQYTSLAALRDKGLGGFLTDSAVYVLVSVFLSCANRPGSKDWGACQHRGDASHTHSWKELFHCYCSGLEYGLLFASWLGFAIGYYIDWSYVKADVDEAWKMLRGW